MIEETLPAEEIKDGDEIRLKVGEKFGWHKADQIKDDGKYGLKACFGNVTVELRAPLYKVRRYSS
jgi:hypothetical protein